MFWTLMSNEYLIFIRCHLGFQRLIMLIMLINTVYFLVFVKSKAWFKRKGSFFAFCYSVTASYGVKFIGDLTLSGYSWSQSSGITFSFNFLYSGEYYTFLKVHKAHTHTHMHSVNNTCKVIVSRNWNTAGVPEIIYIFLPNHHFFPSFIIVTFIVLCFSLQPVYIFLISMDSFCIFLLYINRVIIFILLWLLLFNIMCEAYPWQLCVAFAHSLSLLFCVFFL